MRGVMSAAESATATVEAERDRLAAQIDALIARIPTTDKEQ